MVAWLTQGDTLVVFGRAHRTTTQPTIGSFLNSEWFAEHTPIAQKPWISSSI